MLTKLDQLAEYCDSRGLSLGMDDFLCDFSGRPCCGLYIVGLEPVHVSASTMEKAQELAAEKALATLQRRKKC
jgi:hypothetical protein